MNGLNTNQIFLGNMNCRKKFKPETLFRCDHSSLSPRLRPHISKLGAFSLVCQILTPYDLHMIIHLQTRGILPSLSISFSTRSTQDHISPNQGHSPSFVDSLNMIYTRSYISKLRAFSPVFRFSFQHSLYKIIHL